MNKQLIPVETIQNKIIIIRDKKIILDRDLAELYGVETKRLNEAVKRNIKRFPKDFMFKLNDNELKELVANCDRFENLKYSTSKPYAFTEQGVAMLSSVLNSDSAIFVNIQIMRAFVEMRKLFATNEVLLNKIEQIEEKLDDYDERLEGQDKKLAFVFNALKQLIAEPQSNQNKIGFRVDE